MTLSIKYFQFCTIYLCATILIYGLITVCIENVTNWVLTSWNPVTEIFDISPPCQTLQLHRTFGLWSHTCWSEARERTQYRELAGGPISIVSNGGVAGAGWEWEGDGSGHTLSRQAPRLSRKGGLRAGSSITRHFETTGGACLERVCWVDFCISRFLIKLYELFSLFLLALRWCGKDNRTQSKKKRKGDYMKHFICAK